MREPWTQSTIGECLLTEFSGEWGSEPESGGNATVLRSTDIDDEGHVNLRGGARRTISRSKLVSKKLKCGDILLEGSGGGPGKPVGRVALFDTRDEGAYLCSNFFRTLRASPTVINPSFLAWRLQHIYAQPSIWVFQQQTTGIINLKYRDYLRTSLELPPLPEQRRIAEILDTLDEAIRKTEQIIAKLKQVKQGLLHDLLTRGIDDNGELRDPIRHPEQFTYTQIGQIPRKWELGPATGWCARLTVGVVNSATQAYVASGIPFIRSQNVKPNRIDQSGMLYVTEAFNRRQSKSILRTGDVVIVRTGYPGTAAVVPAELDGANCFSLVIATTLPELDSRFFAQYLNSPGCMAVIDRSHFGSAQHNFNVGEMRRLPLTLPPLTEQRRILEVLTAHEERAETEEQTLRKLSLLKHGSLDDLLTGRVRVTDPPKECVREADADLPPRVES